MVPLESYHSHNTLQRRYVIVSCVCAVLSLRLGARPAVLLSDDVAACVTWNDTWRHLSWSEPRTAVAQALPGARAPHSVHPSDCYARRWRERAGDALFDPKLTVPGGPQTGPQSAVRQVPSQGPDRRKFRSRAVSPYPPPPPRQELPCWRSFPLASPASRMPPDILRSASAISMAVCPSILRGLTEPGDPLGRKCLTSSRGGGLVHIITHLCRFFERGACCSSGRDAAVVRALHQGDRFPSV